MHPDRIKGNWKQFKGNVKQIWGKITFDQINVVSGKNDYLTGQIQESNGISMDKARKLRIARGNSSNESSNKPSTPEIEFYNSPNLVSYAGSVSTILLNLRNGESP